MNTDLLKVYKYNFITILLLILSSCDPPRRLILENNKKEIVCADELIKDIIFDINYPLEGSSPFLEIKISNEIHEKYKNYLNEENIVIYKNNQEINFSKSMSFIFNKSYIFSYEFRGVVFSQGDIVKVDLSDFYSKNLMTACEVIELKVK